MASHVVSDSGDWILKPSRWGKGLCRDQVADICYLKLRYPTKNLILRVDRMESSYYWWNKIKRSLVPTSNRIRKTTIKTKLHQTYQQASYINIYSLTSSKGERIRPHHFFSGLSNLLCVLPHHFPHPRLHVQHVKPATAMCSTWPNDPPAQPSGIVIMMMMMMIGHYSAKRSGLQPRSWLWQAHENRLGWQIPLYIDMGMLPRTNGPSGCRSSRRKKEVGMMECPRWKWNPLWCRLRERGDLHAGHFP